MHVVIILYDSLHDIFNLVHTVHYITLHDELHVYLYIYIYIIYVYMYVGIYILVFSFNASVEALIFQFLLVPFRSRSGILPVCGVSDKREF